MVSAARRASRPRGARGRQGGALTTDNQGAAGDVADSGVLHNDSDEVRDVGETVA